MHVPDALVFVYVSAIRGQLVVYTQLHNQEVNWPLEGCLAKHPDSGFAKESWEDTKRAICEELQPDMLAKQGTPSQQSCDQAIKYMVLSQQSLEWHCS